MKKRKIITDKSGLIDYEKSYPDVVDYEESYSDVVDNSTNKCQSSGDLAVGLLEGSGYVSLVLAGIFIIVYFFSG